MQMNNQIVDEQSNENTCKTCAPSILQKWNTPATHLALNPVQPYHQPEKNIEKHTHAQGLSLATAHNTNSKSILAVSLEDWTTIQDALANKTQQQSSHHMLP